MPSPVPGRLAKHRTIAYSSVLESPRARTVERAQMSLTIIGVICILAAIVGGGLTLAGVKVPVIKSPRRQIALAILGVIVIVFDQGLVDHTVERCGPWDNTDWGLTKQGLVTLDVGKSEKIVDARVELDPTRSSGRINVSSPTTPPDVQISSDRRTASGACSAQGDASSKGYCRIRAHVDTNWFAGGDCG
jgi:hypothetical protein